MRRKEKWLIKWNIQRYFNDLVTTKNIDSEELMYVPSEEIYRVRKIYKGGKWSKASLCTNVNRFPDNLIISAIEFPNEWIGPSISLLDVPPKVRPDPIVPPPKLTKALIDTRPCNARRGSERVHATKRKITSFFNKLRRAEAISSAQLKYNPAVWARLCHVLTLMNMTILI